MGSLLQFPMRIPLLRGKPGIITRQICSGVGSAALGTSEGCLDPRQGLAAPSGFSLPL
jgi:hypothetical protein